MYNGTMRRVRATTVEEEHNKYYLLWVCVFSFWYSVCIDQAPYCHLWPDPLYNIIS